MSALGEVCYPQGANLGEAAKPLLCEVAKRQAPASADIVRKERSDFRTTFRYMGSPPNRRIWVKENGRTLIFTNAIFL